MTVQTTTNVATGIGNGVTTVFPVGYKFNQDTDLVVYLIEKATSIATAQTLNSDYSVQGAGDDDGGSITFLTAAPATGFVVKVTRLVDLLQLTDLRNQGKFFAEVHEDVFDLLVMMIQQVDEVASNSMQLNEAGDRWDARDSRIVNVGDPIAPQDAATMVWAQQYIGSILESWQGPVNNAVNVVYVGPDFVPHTVQDQSNFTDPTLGAALIGRALRTFKSILGVAGADGELRVVRGQYDGEQVFVQGYYDDSRQRGGGQYYWDANSIDTDDGGTIIAVTGVATGRWMMVPRSVSFADFGAKGDGVTDDRDAMRAAVTCRFSKRFPVQIFDEAYATSGIITIGEGVSLQGTRAFDSIIKALPGFVGGAVVRYFEPNAIIRSVEAKNWRVSVNGQACHGIEIRRAYDGCVFDNVVCIDASDGYNAIRITGYIDGAPVTIGQTCQFRGLFAGHANNTATVATMYIENLQESVFLECKAWGAYGASKAPCFPLEVVDCRSLLFLQQSVATTSTYGIKVGTVSRSSVGINFISPLYENVDNILEAAGTGGNFIIGLEHSNPRYQTPIAGGFHLNTTNSATIDVAGRPAVIDSNCAATLLYTSDSSNITNAAASTSVMRRANAVSSFYRISPALEVGPLSGDPHLRTAAPASGETSLSILINTGSAVALKKITIGAADSDDPGFRKIRVAN